MTRRFYTLVRPPELRFDPINIRVHGIRPEDVIDAPSFAEVWREVGPAFDGALVLAHNASFDMNVLKHTAARHGLALPRFRSFCTVAMARRLWPEEPSKKLSALAARFGIGFRHHHAARTPSSARPSRWRARAMPGADIGHLAETTGLAKAVSGGAAPRAGGIASRALAARGVAATGRLAFRVHGSRGTPYEIEVSPAAKGACASAAPARPRAFAPTASTARRCATATSPPSSASRPTSSRRLPGFSCRACEALPDAQEKARRFARTDGP